MSGELLAFLLLSAIAIGGGINLILQRHPIHSALSLIVVMVALAGLYLLLGAEFVAAIQVIVYAGAIMVLFVFVIMLLNAGAEEWSDVSRAAHYAGLPLALALLLVLGYRVYRDTAAMTTQPAVDHTTRNLGFALFRAFAFPFEFTSILLLIALVGALVLAKSDG